MFFLKKKKKKKKKKPFPLAPKKEKNKKKVQKCALNYYNGPNFKIWEPGGREFFALEQTPTGKPVNKKKIKKKWLCLDKLAKKKKKKISLSATISAPPNPPPRPKTPPPGL